MKSRMRLLISSILMTVSLLALVPTGVDLAATFSLRWFECGEKHYVRNYMAPMGFATLAFIGVGMIVTWTSFRNGLRSAWFILALVAWLFYYLVWVQPIGLNWEAFTLDWVLAPGVARDIIIHRIGFGFMVLALLLNAWDSFVKPRSASNEGGPGS